MRLLPPSNTFAQEKSGVTEVERVIITGSNIPSAEEVGPNPVDTYRPADIEKLGVRNGTDLLTNLPISTAQYNPCGWHAWLNARTLTLGMQNVFDSDPPFMAPAVENNYDESLAIIKGRFWNVQLKKRF